MPTGNTVRSAAKRRGGSGANRGGPGGKQTVVIVICAVVAVAVAAAALIMTLGAMKRGDDTTPPTEDSTEDTASGTEPVTEPTEDTTPPETQPVTEPTEDTTPPAPPKPRSPLTNLEVEEDISARRPWAVMFDNIKGAAPQTGITAADMIFEILAEGNITRLMGIYEDFDGMEILGGVRSSREYFAEMALSLDAIYIHAGGSPGAYTFFQKYKVDRIDGVNGSGETFHRDAYRKSTFGTVHALVVETTELDAYAEKYKLRTLHEEGYTAPFTFDDETERTGDRAVSVTAHFGSAKSAKTTGFTYDPESKQYLVSQFGGFMGDTAVKDTVKVRNIIALNAKIYVLNDDDKGRREAELTGKGTGKYIVDGVARDINWERDSRTGFFTLTYPDGTPVALGTGKTYFMLLPMNGYMDLGEIGAGE